MIVALVLANVLLVVEVVLIARLVADWVVQLAGARTAGSLSGRAIGGVVAVTEPVLGPIRRVIRPVRFGGVALDLSFTLVLLAVFATRALLLGVAGP